MKAQIVLERMIEGKIFFIRGHKVMLDRTLAGLYGVETKMLNQAVKRNIKRFPQDFMFQLTTEELENWKSQFVTSNKERMGLRRRPYAFTEHGILMLSSVLNSDQAIYVNIQIMRAFIKLREVLAKHKELENKLKELEGKVGKHGEDIQLIFTAIRQLMEPPAQKQKSRIGFR